MYSFSLSSLSLLIFLFHFIFLHYFIISLFCKYRVRASVLKVSWLKEIFPLLVLARTISLSWCTDSQEMTRLNSWWVNLLLLEGNIGNIREMLEKNWKNGKNGEWERRSIKWTIIRLDFILFKLSTALTLHDIVFCQKLCTILYLLFSLLFSPS